MSLKADEKDVTIARQAIAMTLLSSQVEDALAARAALEARVAELEATIVALSESRRILTQEEAG
jgi:squalene cyclase